MKFYKLYTAQTLHSIGYTATKIIPPLSTVARRVGRESVREIPIRMKGKFHWREPMTLVCEKAMPGHILFVIRVGGTTRKIFQDKCRKALRILPVTFPRALVPNSAAMPYPLMLQLSQVTLGIPCAVGSSKFKQSSFTSFQVPDPD